MKLDLHVHTKYSEPCGFCLPARIIEAARKKGLNGIAICDHGTFAGFEELKAKVPENFILIRGIEINTKDGDILAYGIKEKISNGLPAEETIEEIHKQGGLAIAAHPFGSFFHKPFGFLFGERGSLGNKISGLKLDAVEVQNGRTYFGNFLAKIKAKRFPAVAGSDAHILSEIGNCYVEVEGKTEREILENIKKGKCFIHGHSIRPWTVARYAFVHAIALLLGKNIFFK